MVRNTLNLVFTRDEMERLTIVECAGKDPRIIADVHGMKCRQARRFINNIINIVRGAFQLIIIHGYNHGTAIKDMLLEQPINSHISEQHVDPLNKGITHMLIVA